MFRVMILDVLRWLSLKQRSPQVRLSTDLESFLGQTKYSRLVLLLHVHWFLSHAHELVRAMGSRYTLRTRRRPLRMCRCFDPPTFNRKRQDLQHQQPNIRHNQFFIKIERFVINLSFSASYNNTCQPKICDELIDLSVTELGGCNLDTEDEI